MEEFSKEGRKLRPRRKVNTSEPAYSSATGRIGAPRRASDYEEHKNERRPRPDGERRSFSDRKPYGEHRSAGGDKPFGAHKSFGARKPYGEHKPFGEHGDRREDGARKPYGERRQGSFHKPYGEHRPFCGDKPRYGSKPGSKGHKVQFDRHSDEGIRAMIDRRPKLEGAYEERAAGFPAKEEMRLNKFIANSGVCSRREADTLIQAGCVTVNGEVVTELGTKVNAVNDDIRFNGERLKGEEKVYLVMNKPKGYVTTASDPHADKTVMDLIKGCPARVFPVGRLDKATTGVLMFTNDGEIAERLTHPSYDKKKIYQVILNRELAEEDREKILTGVELSDGMEAADELEFIDNGDHRKLGIEIHSGKNRIVRRLFESLGYDVRALDRVYFAGLTKKGLKKGEWRYLTEGEANILKMGAYV